MDNSLKDKILDAVDIVDVVGERVSLKRKGREFVGLCPFHNDHKPSMSVVPSKQIFKCFSCGAGGDLIKFVQMFHHIEFREALELLAQRAGIDMGESRGDGRANEQREQLRRAMDWARKYFVRNLGQPAGAAALEYAHKRGLADATIERFGIGLALDQHDALLTSASRSGVSREVLVQSGLVATNEHGQLYDRFRHRLIFPICDSQGRCVAFGGRTLGDAPAKYLNSPETPLFSKSRILFALDSARAAIEKQREAIVVEGYLDAVLLHQGGIENVVATLGTALTDAHAKALRSRVERLVLCFDSDEAGVRAADRAVEVTVRHRIDVGVALLPDGQDPADLVVSQGPDALKSLLQSTIPALEFKWNQTRAAFSAAEGHGQQEAVETFLGFIAGVRAFGGMDPMEQSRLVARLADLLNLPARAVYDWLARLRVGAPRNVSDQSPDTSTPSAYDASIEGLPKGLVSAVEELFGLVLSAPACFARAYDSLAAASDRCPVWRQVYEILTELNPEIELSGAVLLARCEESAARDLVIRATRRVGRTEDAAGDCDRLAVRVEAELDAMWVANLHKQARANEADFAARNAAFDSLIDASRHHGLLGSLQQNPLR